MNVSISTFVRRGYLLTALAVAVLLAGFSGTAWAQVTTTEGRALGVRLTMGVSSSELKEGADDMASTPGRVVVTITWSGTYDSDTTLPGDLEDVFVFGDTGGHLKLTATCNDEDFTGAPADSECSFDVEVKEGGTLSSPGTLGSTGASLKFGETPDPNDGADKVVKTIELYISDDDDNGDWDEEEIDLTLELVDKTVTVVTKRTDTDMNGVDAGDAESENQTRKLTAPQQTWP